MTTDAAEDTLEKLAERYTSAERPWRDAEILEELYIGHGLTTYQTADVLDCGATTIQTWLKRHDIDTRSRHDYRETPWRDEEKLRRLYWDEGLSLSEIGEKLGAHQATIWRAMTDLGIERKDKFEELKRRNRVEWASFRTNRWGYERWSSNETDGSTSHVSVHRLLAVAEFGFDAARGKDVHHQNGVPWDNRAENIELLTHEEHSRLHLEERNERGEMHG